jgi:hypothetical protein
MSARKPKATRTDEAKGREQTQAYAGAGLNPVTLNANIARIFARATSGELDASACILTLLDEVTKVQRNDLRRVEATLTAQATALDAIFNDLALRASVNMMEHTAAAEVFMRLALKAQSQCRATLETLSEVKNPRPVAFVRQANIANGPQQVNNDAQSSKLLEAEGGERLDTGAARTAKSVNSPVETLEAIHGTKD